MTDEKKRELRSAAQLEILELSNIPEIYWDEIKMFVPDNDKQAYMRLDEIKNNIIELSEPRMDIQNLLICSDKTGNGKTSWALKILQYFAFKSAQQLYYQHDEDDCWCFFVTVADYVALSKEYDSKRRVKFFHMQDMIEKARIVVFDDVAVGEYSRAEYMALYNAIDKRVLNKQFCIFTSNFVDRDDSVLSNRLGTRLVDRIYDTSEKIVLNGEGVRH
jgi:DNA replication protein